MENKEIECHLDNTSGTVIAIFEQGSMGMGQFIAAIKDLSSIEYTKETRQKRDISELFNRICTDVTLDYRRVSNEDWCNKPNKKSKRRR